MQKKTFSQRVIECALSIPKGRVTTYGRIARAAGAGPMASQCVVRILWNAWQKQQKKPTDNFSKKISAGPPRPVGLRPQTAPRIRSLPLHRIVYADGHIWVDAKHRAERIKLYKKEDLKLDKNDRIVEFRGKLFEF